MYGRIDKKPARPMSSSPIDNSPAHSLLILRFAVGVVARKSSTSGVAAATACSLSLPLLRKERRLLEWHCGERNKIIRFLEE